MTMDSRRGGVFGCLLAEFEQDPDPHALRPPGLATPLQCVQKFRGQKPACPVLCGSPSPAGATDVELTDPTVEPNVDTLVQHQVSRTNVYYPSPWVVLWSGIASFLGMAAIMLLSQYALSEVDLTLTVGSFGATAVLLYAAPHSPLAQPRNLLVGHTVSAVVGVTCNLLIVGLPPDEDPLGDSCVGGGERPALWWLAGSLAVSISIVLMHLLKALHPPGGATALIAVIGTRRLREIGYLYVACPIALGAVVMLCVALLVDNLARGISYPKYWW